MEQSRHTDGASLDQYCPRHLGDSQLYSYSFPAVQSIFSRLDVPDEVRALREELTPLPGRWEAVPSGFTGRKTGGEWIASSRSPLFLVPSVIVPDEHNILVNPLHSESTKVVATTVRRWVYDPRFF